MLLLRMLSIIVPNRKLRAEWAGQTVCSCTIYLTMPQVILHFEHLSFMMTKNFKISIVLKRTVGAVLELQGEHGVRGR